MALCRKLTTNGVDEIAQGRVWSGADALKIGLVDELGGLQNAIAAAAQEAKLGADYSVAEFPAGRSSCKNYATRSTETNSRWPETASPPASWKK